MAASFYGNILEEELKNRVAADWFAAYDTTHIIGRIDFAVAVPTPGPQLFETEYLLWAEAKQGTSHDILESFIQLILTIGKARTYEDKLKKAGIIDADFYLADLLSANNATLKEKLFVLLKSDHYVLDRRVNDTGLENYTQAVFLDNQKAHTQFWNRYKRPPRRTYWDKMVERRDQFLYPNDSWQTDKEFQSDCLAYTLFNNNIQTAQGINHWIPFTEQEVDAKETFKSHFMSDYIRGKAQTGQRSQQPTEQDLFAGGADSDLHATATLGSVAPSGGADSDPHNSPITFSPEAQAVMEAGKALWRYYHAQPDAVADAALYDIRLHFQGLNDRGQMNTGSTDEHYNQLIARLRQSLKLLAQKIEPKVYEYGFLK